jgi:hypothetical protein
MPAGVYTLGDVASRISLLEVACNRCDRRGRLRTSRLLAEHGPDMPMPALLRIIAADCPRLTAERIFDICGIRCPQMVPIFYRKADQK